MCLRKTKVDVRTQSVQRNLTILVGFRSRQLGAVQTARTTNLDAFGTAFHRRLDGTLHRPAERDTLHQLLRDRLGDQLCIDFWLTDLLDLDKHFLVAGDRREEILDLVDARRLFRRLLAGRGG